MKQIGLGLHGYHDSLKTFPPDAIWTSNKFGTNAQMGQQRNFTWIALMLPYIEQGGLHAQINFSAQPSIKSCKMALPLNRC